MLDHLFLDTVAALKAALDGSLLERTAQDDRLVYDLFTGDMAWETSVSLPGDGDPPRVSADLSLDWPTWSQALWRSIRMGDTVEEAPEIGIEVVFRAQRLASRPELAKVLEVLPEQSPEIGGDRLSRSTPVIEEAFEEDTPLPEVAVEVGYEGSYRLPAPSPGEGSAREPNLFPGWAGARLGATDPLNQRLGPARPVPAATAATLDALGTWLASTLVRLADLDLDYLPPPEEVEDD